MMKYIARKRHLNNAGYTSYNPNSALCYDVAHIVTMQSWVCMASKTLNGAQMMGRNKTPVELYALSHFILLKQTTESIDELKYKSISAICQQFGTKIDKKL
jgi:hypothetical protein